MKSMMEGYELKAKQMEADPELKKKLAPFLPNRRRMWQITVIPQNWQSYLSTKAPT